MVRSLICFVVHWLMERYFGITAASHSALKAKADACHDKLVHTTIALRDQRMAHGRALAAFWEEQRLRGELAEKVMQHEETIEKLRDGLEQVSQTKTHTSALVAARRTLGPPPPRPTILGMPMVSK